MKKAGVAALVGAAALVVTAIAVSAAGGPSGLGVQPTQVAMAPANACAGGDKIEDPSDGVYPWSFGGFDGTITIDVTNTSAGPVFSFETNTHGLVPDDHVVTSLYVKGGPTANFYQYAAPGVSADTGLHAPVNPKNGKYYGLSHLCIFSDKLV
jgi:hypothetical protein